MHAQQIAQVTKQSVKSAMARQIKITLKPDSIDYIPNLFGMVNSGIIQMLVMDGAKLTTVVKFRKWEHDDDRTFVIGLTETFDREYFMDKMCQALENLEAVG